MFSDEGNEKSLKKFAREKKKLMKKNKKRKSIFTGCRSKGELSSETKNIPKNYGKQIIKFIKKEKKLTFRMLKSLNSEINFEELNFQL